MSGPLRSRARVAGFAGFVDAIVGGGGLILCPPCSASTRTLPPATLFGTNKGAAVWGTALRPPQFARRVSCAWPALLRRQRCAAAVGSLAGAWGVTLVSAQGLRQSLPFVLLCVLVYTIARKDMGRRHAPRLDGRTEALVAGAIGLLIGFYDGFFGPGTGSFFVFLFVRLLGYDFLHASASAKLLNTATNLAALALFGLTGHVWWQIAP